MKILNFRWYRNLHVLGYPAYNLIAPEQYPPVCLHVLPEQANSLTFVVKDDDDDNDDVCMHAFVHLTLI